ncbi:MAG: Tat pathway signal protein [Verrucomicrobiota bacterium]|nr:Tat pathway signal protein [Verrucomicrobiota bacterium]
MALLAIILDAAAQPAAPTNVVVFSGDLSVILHWDPDSSSGVSGYNVYRSLNGGGPFTQLNGGLVTALGYCDLTVSDGQTYYYQVTAVNASSQTSPPSATLSTTPNPFPNDDAFLDYLEEANFDYFWYTANPVNGLVPDRSTAGSACSIASVGFGLTAIGIAIDHGWITRDQGAARVLTTLNTFWNGPQGANASGDIGYNGWFYHFLDMNTATRSGSSELSSIDTALLLAGVLYAKQYFNATNAAETSIRTLAGAIFNRVNWLWMAPDIPSTNGVRMGWLPGSGFSGFGDWIGYDEAMLLYLLGMGATTNSLPPACWSYWTSGYTWASYYGESFVPFPPLFGHEYSHCWVDFRHVGDAYMNAKDSTYFENSHRAALAQQAYCAADPLGWPGYSSTVWGLTASDGPSGYAAHGAPPALNDDGTIAFTAPGGALAFAPEIALPTMEYFYTHGRQRFWTQYGFIDAFNLAKGWYDNTELGIDQGPIVIMAENYRNQNVWRLFVQNPEVRTGLQRAGFVPLPFVTNLTAQIQPLQGTVTLAWPAVSGRTYQVEYSTNLLSWFMAPTGEITATNTTASWTDSGPPGTFSAPLSDTGRFYRVFQYGSP